MATIKVYVKTLFMKQINCDFTHARMHTHTEPTFPQI
jgi:hypothetical protein